MCDSASDHVKIAFSGSLEAGRGVASLAAYLLLARHGWGMDAGRCKPPMNEVSALYCTVIDNIIVPDQLNKALIEYEIPENIWSYRVDISLEKLVTHSVER